jgi:maltodextrin utilization protein YvdJ
MADELNVETPETDLPKVVEEDLYHKPNRLIRISLWANTLSWIILVITVVLTGFYIYSIYMGKASGVQLFASLTNLLYTIAPGIFFFIALQAISEGIYILLDIMDGVRSSPPK